MDIISRIASIHKIISIEKNIRKCPKIIVKSDMPLWFHKKETRIGIGRHYGINASVYSIHQWIIRHIDYICAQNEEFKKLAISRGIPETSIIVSNMGVPNDDINLDKLENPYDINHSYCVWDINELTYGKAWYPLYYQRHPEKIKKFNKKKTIIVYTGRIKTDRGKIFFNMKNIMEILGNKYELHIFPGSFTIPLENETIKCSARNGAHLEKLRKIIFGDSRNIIIHYPYEHQYRYQYLYYADCGIDFSDVRPDPHAKSIAGHAKLLEYCELGLPIVCENNINNVDLVIRGKNGIVLPYLASDDEYASAIRTLCQKKIDREYCRKITISNENWDNKAREFLEQIYKS
jgi:glycosyltransferase involved in cell wall biosynthesis